MKYTRKILFETPSLAPYSHALSRSLAILFLALTMIPRAGAEIPSRIASLSLASDEILLAILTQCGGMNRLAALSVFADDPRSSSSVEAAKAVKGRVHSEPESLFKLRPDLVIAASFNRPELLKMIESRKIPVVTLTDFATAEDIAKHIQLIGDRVGCPEPARKLRDDFLRRVTPGPAPKILPRVMLYSEDLSVMGKGTLFDDLVRRAGAINAPSERGLVKWPRIDTETLLAMKPDKIIVFGEDSPAVRKAIISHPAWGRLEAVKAERFIFMDGIAARSTSHFFADAIEELRAKLR